MQVKANQIRKLREQNNWTQQYLADACGVSLRTIQRIEKTGNAAPDTVMGLCAVFEVKSDDIKTVPKFDQASVDQVSLLASQLYIAISILIGMCAGAAITYLFLAY